MRHFNIIICFVFWCACASDTKTVAIRNISLPPFVSVDSLADLSATRYNTNVISASKPHFIGVYTFGDTLFLPYNRDKLLDKYRLFLDFGRDSIKKAKAEASWYLPTNGLQLIADTTTIGLGRQKLMAYMSIYIINKTRENKKIHGKDDVLYGIQEAQDKEGVWQPIEGEVQVGCGCCGWSAVIQPNQFAIALVRKYEGSFKTNIRTRLQIGDSIYISPPYSGSINSAQFLLDKRGFVYDKITNEKRSTAFIKEHFFYGTAPMEISINDPKSDEQCTKNAH